MSELSDRWSPLVCPEPICPLCRNRMVNCECRIEISSSWPSPVDRIVCGQPPPGVRPALEAVGWVVMDEIPDDPGEARKLLSQQLGAFGDTVWAEIRKRKDWEED